MDGLHDDPRRALLEHVPLIVLTVDADGRVDYANSVATRALGSSVRSPLGQRIGLFAPDLVGPASSWSAFAETTRRSGRTTRHGRLRALDGRVVPAELTIEWLTFGGVDMLAVFARDLRNDAGWDQDQRFARFSLDQLPEAVYCIRGDGSFTYVNQAACDMLGFSREELLAKGIFGINPALAADRWDKLWQALLQQRKRSFKSAHLTKDGRLIHVEIQSSLFEVAGESFSCCFSRDITEQQSSEEARQRDQAFVEGLVDTAPVMVVVLDSQGRLVRFNRCAERITGYRSEDVLGQRWLELMVAEPDRAQVATLMRESMAGGTMRGTVYNITTRDGGVRQILWNDQLLAGQTAGSVGLLAIGQDVTEQRGLEQRLRQAEKMEAIGRLAGGIAHDFNNQLTAIMGYADVLAGELESNPDLAACTTAIMTAVRRSCDLTSQLLAYSRKGKYVTSPVDLHDLVHEVVSILERSLDKRIVIRLDLAAPVPRTMGDPTQLGNALLNLALNARDAMPDGGTLTFATRAVVINQREAAAHQHEIDAGAFVKLTVSDTGTGMDEETQRHLFEPFFTTKEEGRGTGLGLAAVYGTVKSHRGTISVASTVGFGTSVRICLPVTHLAESDLATPVPVRSAPVPPLNVLLVDDEALVREITERLLRHMACGVAAFGNGFDAIEHYRAHWQTIDLVILDMVMPLMDGKSTYYALRRINPDVRVILASGYSVDGEAQALLNEGVAAFLQKPFRSTTLADTLARVSLLSGRREARTQLP
ncbi:MAG TPA: PAS domain S-box protein [Polyangia bacterium]|nr:PAS domain S-box protein [Polyangia bacterium]